MDVRVAADARAVVDAPDDLAVAVGVPDVQVAVGDVPDVRAVDHVDDSRHRVAVVVVVYSSVVVEGRAVVRVRRPAVADTVDGGRIDGVAVVA